MATGYLELRLRRFLQISRAKATTTCSSYGVVTCLVPKPDETLLCQSTLSAVSVSFH